ncbi:hypothetical protein ACIO14_24740 [Nocardia fluminea]|uniref:hypothetical protein n=1 Tax=Nocardia fluminea TaxID=134984 RepID=UPI003814BCEB
MRAATIFVHPDADALSHLVALIDSGELHVEIARRVPLPSPSRRRPGGDQPLAVGAITGHRAILNPLAMTTTTTCSGF